MSLIALLCCRCGIKCALLKDPKDLAHPVVYLGSVVNLKCIYLCMRGNHGLLPDLLISVRQNAQQVLGDTLLGCSFLSPSYLIFHNLTPGRYFPLSTIMVLGVFTKIILHEAVTTKEHAIESFENVGWEIQYASRKQEFNIESKSELHTDSTNRQPLSQA